MKIKKILAMLIIALVSMSMTSCSLSTVDGDEEGVFVKKPWFFGKGGVVMTALTNGSEWKVFTTSFYKMKKVPTRYDEMIDDTPSDDNTPMDVSAYTTIKIKDGKSPILLKNFGLNWYKNNIQIKFRSLIRDQISEYPMYDLASNRNVLLTIESNIKSELEKIISKNNMPLDIVSVDINRCLPNKNVIDAMNQTSVMIQEKQTQQRRVEEEIVREKAETAKANADRAYMKGMHFSPNEFINLQWVNVAMKNGSNIDVMLDPTANKMWNIRR